MEQPDLDRYRNQYPDWPHVEAMREDMLRQIEEQETGRREIPFVEIWQAVERAKKTGYALLLLNGVSIELQRLIPAPDAEEPTIPLFEDDI